MSKKIVLTSAILMAVLGVNATSNFAYQNTSYETVATQSTNKGTKSGNDSYMNMNSSVYVSNYSSSFDLYGGFNYADYYNLSDESVRISIPYGDNYNGFATTKYLSIGNTYSEGSFFQIANLGVEYFPEFDSSLATLVTPDGTKYNGYFGYLDGTDTSTNEGTFTRSTLANPTGDGGPADKNSKIAFEFYGIEQGTDLTGSQIYLYNATESGIDSTTTWETVDESSLKAWALTPSEDSSAANKEQAYLPDFVVPFVTDVDPFITDSISVSQNDSSNVTVTFSYNDQTSTVFPDNNYLVFDPGTVTAPTSNISFTSDEGDITSTLVDVTPDTTSGQTTVTYKLDTAYDASYNNVKATLTYTDSTSSTVTNTYDIASLIETQYSNPIDTTKTKLKADAGQITGHVEFLEGAQYVNASDVDSLELLIDGAPVDMGTTTGYEFIPTNIDGSTGLSFDFAIINHDSNDFGDFTNLSLRLKTTTGGNTYTYDLLNEYTDPGVNTLITSISDTKAIEVSEDQTEAQIWFDVDGGTEYTSTTSILSELEAEEIRIGYGSSSTDETWAIDTSLNPTYTTGEYFTIEGSPEVQRQDGEFYAGYTVTGLTPNTTYEDLFFDTAETFRTYDSTHTITTSQLNPIIDNSGIIVATDADAGTADITFSINEDDLGKDYYQDVVVDSAEFRYDGGTLTAEYVEPAVKTQSQITYSISGLFTTGTYENIEVRMNLQDADGNPIAGEYTEWTPILSELSLDLMNPIIVNSFEQDFAATTNTQAVFTFNYRESAAYIEVPADATWKVGYGSNEFASVTMGTPTEIFDGVQQVQVTITGLSPFTDYSNIWVQYNDEEAINGKTSSGEAFDIITSGSNPIVTNSGKVSNVTDTTAQISFDYHKSGTGYYELNPATVKLGYVDGTEETSFRAVELISDEAKTSTLYTATYQVNRLDAGTTYSGIYAEAPSNIADPFVLEDVTIFPSTTGEFTTLGENPIVDTSVEFQTVRGTDGTEATVSFYYYTEESSMATAGSTYSEIDLDETVIGYGSSEAYTDSGTEATVGMPGKGPGVFEAELESTENTVPGLLSKATYHITGLEANTQYNDIYIKVKTTDGNELSEMKLTGDNSYFISLPEALEPIPMTPFQITVVIAVPLILILLIILFIGWTRKLYKNKIALGMYLDVNETTGTKEIVYDLVHVKHIHDLWNAHEDSLVLIAGGVEVEAIFRRAHSNMTGYKMYVNLPVDDGVAMASLFNAIKYNTFYLYSSETKKEHHYHINILEDKKVHKLQTKLSKLSQNTPEQAKQELLEALAERREYSVDEDENYRSISTINRAKSTSTTLRYQVLYSEDHWSHEAFEPDSKNQKMYYIVNGKAYELEYKFVSHVGPMYEYDIVNLEPGTIYAGLSLSQDNGKTILPSSSMYGITKNEDGKIPSKTEAKLPTPKKTDKAHQMWTLEAGIERIGEETTIRSLDILHKKHQEEFNGAGKISADKAFEKYRSEFYDEWVKGVKKTTKKATNAEELTKEEKLNKMTKPALLKLAGEQYEVSDLKDYTKADLVELINSDDDIIV